VTRCPDWPIRLAALLSAAAVRRFDVAQEADAPQRAGLIGMDADVLAVVPFRFRHAAKLHALEMPEILDDHRLIFPAGSPRHR
jgi:hypothetical protein